MDQSRFENSSWLWVIAGLIPIFKGTIFKSNKIVSSSHIVTIILVVPESSTTVFSGVIAA